MGNLPDPVHSRAILIGTSDYERSASLPALPAVGNNLQDLRRALTDPRTGILDHGSCFVIDTPDSPKSMFDRLSRVAAQAEDLLLVYYAGHGIRHDTKDLLYLAVRDTNTDSLGTTAVPFELIRELLEESKARTRVLILDCCYSGMAIGFMSDDALSTREITVSGTSVITSVSKNDKALAPPGERHTAFTGELISLLENGSRLRDEPLTLRVAYRSLRAALAVRGLPTPKMASGDTSGELLLRRIPVPLVEPVPVTPPPAVMATSDLSLAIGRLQSALTVNRALDQHRQAMDRLRPKRRPELEDLRARLKVADQRSTSMRMIYLLTLLLGAIFLALKYASLLF